MGRTVFMTISMVAVLLLGPWLMAGCTNAGRGTEYALRNGHSSIRDNMRGDPVDEQGNGAQPVVSRQEEWELARQGIEFHVEAVRQSPVTTLTITPRGLEIDNRPLVREVDGTVSGVELADLNEDESPEIYIYVTSDGSGSYGSLVAYAANRRKSLSEIYLPPLMQDEVAARGYMGHDEFEVGEGVLLRRFPIYNNADTNARPTGGIRELRYKLISGEAGWRLDLDGMVEF